MSVLNRAAKKAEAVLGHTDKDLAATTDISSPNRDGGKYADPSGETMKALVWMGKNDVRVMEVSKPRIVDDRDVIVRVTGSTVCGSDVHLLHGVIVQTERGDILGHEFCGIIEQVGPRVVKRKVGDRVVNSFAIACGECRFCKQGLTTACDRTNASTVQKMLYGEQISGAFGYSHFVGGYAGGQAEYVRVPIADQNLLKLPDNVPFEKGLYLSDVLPTSYHSVSDTGVAKGDVVAVWGLGPIGFMACMWAFKKGAARVIAIDNNWRTDYARLILPGLETINFNALDKQTVPAKIHEMVPGGVDVCIEASGGEYAKSLSHKLELASGMEQDTSEIVNECIYSVRKFGTVGMIADYVGFTNHFNIGAVMERGIRFIGCGQCPVQKYWDELLPMIQNNEVNPLSMVTHRIGMEDLAKAYYLQESRGEGWLKCFVETRFSEPRAEGSPELKKL
ncbi:chaperonin 10-like protein [Paraphoma chrysanthemicola]|nr:chaperonin 10-like protein [Paraphoma chrysanthemicola]